MKLVDFENHYYTPETISLFEKRTGYPYMEKDTRMLVFSEYSKSPIGLVYDKLLDWSEIRLKEMDQNGVDMAVLSCSCGIEEVDEEECIDICRINNDAVARVIKQYPDRFLGSAILPVKNPEKACLELERCVKSYGFVSWQTHSNYGKHYPDEEFYQPIFKKAAELGVYVYLHPSTSSLPRLEDFGFALTGATLGFTIDTVITLCRLIFQGVFDEIPKLSVMLGHLGEGLPFLLERMDNRYELLKVSGSEMLKNRKKPSEYFHSGQILVTTSGNMSEAAFQCAKEVLGIENILFGSDYPYEKLDDMMGFIEKLSLTEDERSLLYFKNAERILGVSL